jgi:hypothetical protein
LLEAGYSTFKAAQDQPLNEVPTPNWVEVLKPVPPLKRTKVRQEIRDHHWEPVLLAWTHDHPLIYNSQQILAFKPLSYVQAIKHSIPQDEILRDSTLTLNQKLDFLMDMGLPVAEFVKILGGLLQKSEHENSSEVEVEIVFDSVSGEEEEHIDVET